MLDDLNALPHVEGFPVGKLEERLDGRRAMLKYKEPTAWESALLSDLEAAK
jgi:hypothetical protein